MSKLFTWTRITVGRRDRRGYKLEYFHGDLCTFEYVSWRHYDLACDWLQRHGVSRRRQVGCLNDVDQVMLEFSADDLRAMIGGK